MAELDEVEKNEGSSGSHKMIIFSFHHKVLDGVQAEDRAHRHGQKRLVNIYIYCAKDTSDELHWQRLNTSLLRVSSTVNGKHDAMQEMEVESVSYLEAACKTSERNKQVMPGKIENEDNRYVEKIMKSHTACSYQDSQPEGASIDLHIPVEKMENMPFLEMRNLLQELSMKLLFVHMVLWRILTAEGKK